MTPTEDQKLEVAIAHMLRIGVIVAAMLVFLGGILYLTGTNAPVPHYSHFHPVASDMGSFSVVLSGISVLRPESFIQLGILVLIATPVLRVIFCIVGFGMERDWLYVSVSVTVFAVLIYSLLRAGR
jgi:uncharacterized membrane protein